MTVHPLAPGLRDLVELITVRGLRLIESCPVRLAAGSLVPEAVVAAAPSDARVIDTAALDLDDIIDEIVAAHEKGQDVARVHSGDPSSTVRLPNRSAGFEALGIDYAIVPGVSACGVAAAGLGIELTVPEVTQTLILTRTGNETTCNAAGEELDELYNTGATLAIHLSVRNLRQIERDLTPYYGADCPVIVAYRVGWPDEAYIHGTLETIRATCRRRRSPRTALIFVGRGLGHAGDFRDSALYDAAHAHNLRPKQGRAGEDDGWISAVQR